MKLQFFKTTVTPCHMAPSDERKALELMELCGRCAYKSEEKITPDSARAFVLMLKKHGHLSVLEHSNVVLKIQSGLKGGGDQDALESFRLQLLNALNERAGFHRVSRIAGSPTPAMAVAGNFRSWIETLKMFEAKNPDLHAFFLGELGTLYPSLFSLDGRGQHDFSFTLSLMKEEEQLEALLKDPGTDLPAFVFKLICDRGITHEVVRHRVFSFTQESTRYVNYRNRGMALMVPEELEPYFNEQSGHFEPGHALVDLWIDRGNKIFQWYQDDISRGLKPQIARDILPNLLKSEIFVTGRWSGWRHFIRLRDSMAAHPRIRSIAREVRTYFEELGLHVDS